jgi:Cd2+/Zn2+-exporting ATPase
MVLAGSINKLGTLTVGVTRPFADSSISRILDMVENANSRKAVTEKFITRFARIYSPLVVFGALAVALLPPLLTGASFSVWLYRALVVLVISCPCALVISIPLGYFGGVGGASRRGILVKGSNFLDVLASVKTVIFDKTGTLTKGNFKVTQVIPQNGFSEQDLLRLAAQAEVNSNHPIAHSIREAYGELSTLPIQEYQVIAGHGVQATFEDQVLLAGNDPLLHRENVVHDLDTCDVPGTVVHVALDGKHAGFLVISDELKEDALDTVRGLRSCGIEHIAILTGDTQDTAQEIAGQLDVDDFRARLLPEEKVSALEEILAGIQHHGKVAFIGDGINDAPALARADVGIAMGALGSEAAIETADVVIMTDSPAKVVEAIRIGRKTRRIVWQNIAFALAVKGIFIVLGISGEATMWQAVFGDMGVALIAVLNATRVLR